MTRAALITTTINVPNVLVQWARSGMTHEDIIIVAGDKKSPHDKIVDVLATISEMTGVNTQYLAPHVQERWAISEVIGWNCIQRRNIALLEAMSCNPQYIVTVDDDNIPVRGTQFQQLLNSFEEEGQWTSSESGWVNPGDKCFTRPHGEGVIHRGYPLSQWRPKRIALHPIPSHEFKIGVSAMLWTGDPDIDAITRITLAPEVHRISHIPLKLAPGTWAPFNTQATAFLGELAPFMMMWPHVGRYDDIWASYVTRRAMDHLDMGARYGTPEVHQDRNAHDLIKDLEDELFGMRHNERVIERLRSITFHANDTHFEMALNIFHVFSAENYLPHNTRRAFGAWLKDLRTLGYQEK